MSNIPHLLPRCALALSLLTGCSRDGERGVVERATAALGGSAAIRAAATISLDGSGETFALGQNRAGPDSILRWRVSDYRLVMDLDRQRWREEAVWTPAFVTGYPDSFRVVSGYGDGIAYDVEDGTAARLDSLAARARRADLYHHPLGFLRAAAAEGAALEPADNDAGESVRLVTPDGARFTLTIHPGTGLPIRIVSTGHEPALGDVTVATELSDYARTGDLMLPGRMVRSVDGTVVADLRIARTAVTAGGEDLRVPSEAAAATSSPARVTVDTVSPGIWYLTGEGHHSVVVEFADHLTLIEAPVDDRRTLAVIERARALRPGKPLTHVVNTHQHFDHSGGIRAAIAEGLTVITHRANRRFYEDVARRPSTVARDALSRRPRPLTLELVDEKKVLTDGRRIVELYPVTGSGHSASMLMAYFPKERILVEADVYQPPPPGAPAPVRHPFAGNLLENIERRGLRVDRLLPIHGRIVPLDSLVAAARLSAAPAR